MHDFFIKLTAKALEVQLMAGKSWCQNNLHPLLLKRLSGLASIHTGLVALLASRSAPLIQLCVFSNYKALQVFKLFFMLRTIIRAKGLTKALKNYLYIQAMGGICHAQSKLPSAQIYFLSTTFLGFTSKVFL